MSLLLRRNASVQVQRAISLTTSGDLINDAYRDLGVEGDGATTPTRRTGAYGAYTNLVTNGGFETNTTGWYSDSSATLSRNTSQFYFGSASLRVITPGSVSGEGARYGTSGAGRIEATTGEVWTAQVRALGPTSSNIYLRVQEYSADTGGFLRSTDKSIGPLTSSWAESFSTVTLGASTTHITVHVVTVSATVETFYLDGAQAVESPIALPYVDTDGGTAAAVAGRIQIPSTGMDITRGAVVMRLRPAWSEGDASSLPYPFLFAGIGNNRLYVQLNEANGIFAIVRRTAGDAGTAATYNATIVDGTPVSYVGKWDDAAQYIAAEGGVFSSQANALLPTVTTIDLGSNQGAANHLEGDIHWAALYGPGGALLGDADSAYINSLGNNASWEDMPLKEHLVAFWDGRANYYWSFV